MDTVAETTGLEVVGYVLSPFIWIGDQCSDFLDRYVVLVSVAEENARLQEQLRKTQLESAFDAEDRAELARLRKLLRLEALYERPGIAARVIAKRFGPQSVLKTITINKGYLDGAVTGTPVVTEVGVVGRVLRASPHAATVIMLTDPGFRLSVITRESRTPGIVGGTSGPENRLDMTYVAQTAHIAPGDILITSGMDETFPKGVPVGIVTRVMPGNETLFQQVHASPLVDMDYLEEVILLHRDGDGPPLLERPPLEDAGAVLDLVLPDPSRSPSSSGQEMEEAPQPPGGRTGTRG